MSQEEFEDLLANDSIEDLRDYARLMNDSLALDNGLWDGQKALREEYATAKEKYGGTDNIPADVMQSLTERMEPY